MVDSALKGKRRHTMNDWNGDGKEDWADEFLKYELMKETEKGISGKGYSLGGSIFGIVVGVCVGICILALLMGIAIPGAVISLFLEIILFVGVITFIAKSEK